MSDDYTPTTGDIKLAWSVEVDDIGHAAVVPARVIEFNNWLAKVKADTLREAADEIRDVFSDPDRKRPRDPEGVVATDYLNDTGWAEHIVRTRADLIEGSPDE